MHWLHCSLDASRIPIPTRCYVYHPITHSAFRIFSMVKQKLSLYERKFFPFWIIIILNNFYWYSWKKIKFVIENSVKQNWEINSISLLLKRMREALVKLSIPFIFQITGLSSLQIGIKTPLLQKILSFRLLSWLDWNLNKYIRYMASDTI